MALFLRVAQIEDLDEILDLEKRKLQETIPNESDRELASWNARWRREALEHYLPLGWSFLARDEQTKSPFSSEGLLLGYFLAQPLLFLSGQTQSLWLEHLQHTSLMARDELCELAYKIAREKHLQKVYFPNANMIANSVKQFKSELWAPNVIEIKTTKASS